MDINTFGLGDILNLNRVRHRDKKLLPQAACIYFAVAKDVVLYIGKTENLNKRWIGHHKDYALSSIDDVYIYYLQVDIGDLSIYEGSLIRRFNPALNEVTPLDPLIKANDPKGIVCSIRIDEDIYTSLCQTVAIRKARGENTDVTKLINEYLKIQFPVFIWDQMEKKMNQLEQVVIQLEQKITSLEN